MIVLAASLGPGPGAWGIDLPAYLSPPGRTIVAILGILGVGMLLLAMLRPERPLDPNRGQARATLLHRAPWLLLVPLAFLLWSFRTRSLLLGDQMVWVECFHAHEHRLFSEPLAAGIWYAYVAGLEWLKVGPGLPVLALLPVLCGVAAATLLWNIAEYLVPRGKPRVFPFLLLLTMGTLELYCGYIESYPLVSVAILAFVWLGLRETRAEGSGIPLAASFGVAVASHLVALYLLPSYLYLALRRKKPWIHRLGLAFLPALIGVPVIFIAAHRGYDFLNPLRTLWTALLVSVRNGPASGSGAFPLVHQASDLANLLLLVMPVPLLILLSRFVSLKGDGIHFGRRDVLLGIMALSGLLVAAALVIPGSPAQDWDLVSLTVIPLAVLSVARRSEGWDPLHDSKLIRGGLLALALASSLAFVWVNADPVAGTKRFKMLLSPAARLSVHERAYGNEKLMKLHATAGERDSSLVYARRALDANPANIRYWTNVGLGFYQDGRYDEAIPYLEEALRRDPKRWTARYDLGLCYLNTKRYVKATESIAIAVQDGGDRPDVLHALGTSLFRSGKVDSAVSVWNTVLARWPEYAERLKSGSAYSAPP